MIQSSQQSNQPEIQMSKHQQISAKILQEMQANGGNLRAAFDAVMGEGAYMKLASDLYDALRAKAAA